MQKEEFIKSLIEKGALITPDVLSLTEQELAKIVEKLPKELKGVVIDKKFVDSLTSETKSKTEETRFQGDARVKIVKSYEGTLKKREISDFIFYLKARYSQLKRILLERSSLQEATSINKLSSEGCVIGLVYDVRKTASGNYVIRLEDPTGAIDCVISKSNGIVEDAKEIVHDEVIGVKGVKSGASLFVKELCFPDVPIEIKPKHAKEECYAAFISDTHFGLKQFLQEDFERFLRWLNKEECSAEDEEIIDKIRYLFVLGDIVEGVGVYPNQEKDLEVKDIYEQYKLAADYFARVPKHISIIICPGNHDAVRLLEPQPGFDKEFAEPLFKLSNAYLVSNPAMVNIHASKDFPGYNVLLYHGFSFPYYAENVESIRSQGGLLRADLIMKFLLRKRHLSPAHTSNLYVPDPEKDFLVIDKIPDVFASGHIHRLTVTTYRNIFCFNCSCWASQTEDMERRGIVPEPSKVILLNLKTRNVIVKDFAK